MELKGFCVVTFILMLGFSSAVGEYVGLSANQCAIPANDRVDCGYPEVTAEQCNKRGCCFDSSIPEVPWCFKPLQDTVMKAGEADAVVCLELGQTSKHKKYQGHPLHPGALSVITIFALPLDFSDYGGKNRANDFDPLYLT
ncbi:trefoil factor 3 [Gracilinanus agilis]|uniref:trefoil factor 3 n=1 Tax=Gracilinanus agilis TaxID=191870 RepID=UPI001CFE61A6|nr:trefoil factor 3 [Gracilinanus agilis]